MSRGQEIAVIALVILAGLVVLGGVGWLGYRAIAWMTDDFGQSAPVVVSGQPPADGGTTAPVQNPKGP